jgi:DNA-binding GntR family transcriptional regulator
MSHPAAPARYRQLADTLIRDIGTGKYRVGALLPTEFELSDRYGVSRHTVREAFRRLADMGLISRRPGVGTSVKAKTADQRYVASLSSLSDLFQYTKRTRLKVLAERQLKAGARLAAMLHCKRGQAWLEFETCRYLIGTAQLISYTQIYVYPDYVAIRGHLDKRGVWVYGLVERYYGERIVEVQQEIGAVSIEPRIAAILGVRPGSAGLQVLRYYIGRGKRLLSVSMNIYPGNRFKFSTQWRLEWERD